MSNNYYHRSVHFKRITLIFPRFMKRLPLYIFFKSIANGAIFHIDLILSIDISSIDRSKREYLKSIKIPPKVLDVTPPIKSSFV